MDFDLFYKQIGKYKFQMRMPFRYFNGMLSVMLWTVGVMGGYDIGWLVFDEDSQECILHPNVGSWGTGGEEEMLEQYIHYMHSCEYPQLTWLYRIMSSE